MSFQQNDFSGGMRGLKGQFSRPDNDSFLNATNMIVDGSGSLVQRGGAVEEDVVGNTGHVLYDTDVILPFKFRGEIYYFVYDPLHSIRLTTEREGKNVAGHRTSTAAHWPFSTAVPTWLAPFVGAEDSFTKDQYKDYILNYVLGLSLYEVDPYHTDFYGDQTTAIRKAVETFSVNHGGDTVEIVRSIIKSLWNTKDYASAVYWDMDKTSLWWHRAFITKKVRTGVELATDIVCRPVAVEEGEDLSTGQTLPTDVGFHNPNTIWDHDLRKRLYGKSSRRYDAAVGDSHVIFYDREGVLPTLIFFPEVRSGVSLGAQYPIMDMRLHYGQSPSQIVLKDKPAIPGDQYEITGDSLSIHPFGYFRTERPGHDYNVPYSASSYIRGVLGNLDATPYRKGEEEGYTESPSEVREKHVMRYPYNARRFSGKTEQVYDSLAVTPANEFKRQGLVGPVLRDDNGTAKVLCCVVEGINIGPIQVNDVDKTVNYGGAFFIGNPFPGTAYGGKTIANLPAFIPHILTEGVPLTSRAYDAAAREEFLSTLLLFDIPSRAAGILLGTGAALGNTNAQKNELAVAAIRLWSESDSLPQPIAAPMTYDPLIGAVDGGFYRGVAFYNSRLFLSGCANYPDVLSVSSRYSPLNFSALANLGRAYDFNAPPETVDNDGFYIPFTREGGVEVFWVASVRTELFIGTDRGTIRYTGDIRPQALAEAQFDQGMILRSPPGDVLNALYYVGGDDDKVFLYDKSFGRDRFVAVDVGSSIYIDHLFGNKILRLFKGGDNNSLVIFTDKGGVFFGRVKEDYTLAFTQLKFAGPVDALSEVDGVLYLSIGASLYKVRVTDFDTPIEDVEVSFTPLSPCVVAMGDPKTYPPAVSEITIGDGLLLGEFDRDVALGSFVDDIVQKKLSRPSKDVGLFGDAARRNVYDSIKFLFRGQKNKVIAFKWGK